MWRRAYLFLILVRLYFALSPSYLHPDENFQGPEVIAGRLFSYPVHHTWEFTADHPIRSAFPLWIIYGLPMYILRCLWEGTGKDEVAPAVVYWTLRVLMFILSFVLEDWALHELVHSPRQRRVAVLLVASSYVTWTYQTHTFSNSIEVLVLLWSLVLIGRIVEDKEQTAISATAALAFLVVLGTFNRITFPAYLLVPALQLLPHFRRRPFSLWMIVISGALFTLLAIAVDTSFYNSETFTFSNLRNDYVITPLNNLLYNTSSVNLAQHGIHPYYQHIIANLPQLLGPAFPLLFFSFRKTYRLASAISGVLLLSIFPHQEARFLLPAVPLILSSVRLPQRFTRMWIGTWIVFNVFMGFLMGVFHQGGVVPVQMYLAKQDDVSHAFWWKTYSPPIWLLNGRNADMATTDLMGMPGDRMVEQLLVATSCETEDAGSSQKRGVVLVAPRSATFLDQYKGLGGEMELRLKKMWSYQNHLNLDDMDFGDDGVWETLKRVIGRRGLAVWEVERDCGFVQ